MTDLVGGLVPGYWGGVGVGGSPTAGVGLSWGSSGWARWGCVGGGQAAMGGSLPVVWSHRVMNSCCQGQWVG